MHEPSSTHDTGIVDEAVARLRALYGERLVAVYQCPEPLYADDDEAADMEFIVVLRGPVDRWHEVKSLSAIASDIGLEHTLVIFFFPFGEAEIERGGWQVADGMQRGLRVA